MSLRRGLAAGVVAASGVGVAVPNATQLAGAGGTYGLALAGLGVVLGLALFAGGVLLYRSDVATRHLFRVAAWNALGVVVLGLVLVLTNGYLATPLPTFVVADVLGVSAVAHVLIGVNDVRRIRAQELAREREKLSVLNRVLRHNLRNDAQVLLAAGQHLRAGVDGDLADSAATVTDVGTDLGSMSSKAGDVQDLFDRGSPDDAVAVREVIESLLAEYREAHPDARFTAEIEGDPVAVADDRLRTAVSNLLENAVDHAGPAVEVTVSARREDGAVVLAVADDGPGIPDEELAVVTGEQSVTQLAHASGLGLWIVRWFADVCDGSLDVERPAAGGSVVTMRLPAA